MNGKMRRGRSFIAGLMTVLLVTSGIGSLTGGEAWAAGTVKAVGAAAPARSIRAAGRWNPSTPYAQQFLADCEGQQWFLEEVERLLNSEQKTIETITTSGAFSHITSLGLAGKGIQGKIPKAIGELTELKYLFLSDNQLAGELPQELFTLDKLENVDLSNNEYGGGIPAGFGTMTSLKQLLLAGNKLEGGIPSTILNNTRITVLELSQNQLTGGIPSELNRMTGLEYLGLSQNALGGPLPDLSALSRLKVLSAWNCVLSGEFPATLYQNTKLEILDLAGNSLTGSLTDEMGNWKQMKLLSLGSNRLEGTLPDTMNQLTHLKDLDLSDNFFAGQLPDVFSSMSALTTVRLSDNRLQGTLPDSLVEQVKRGVALFAENNYLSGEHLTKADAYQQNFCDEASNEQYQLVFRSLSTPIRLVTGQSINLYPYLKNRNLRTGSLISKPVLKPEDYRLTIKNGEPSKVTVEISSTSGIRLTALAPIDYGEGYVLELCIAGNEGSSRSTVAFQIFTGERPSTPGGGGGGGGGGRISTEGALDLTGKAIDVTPPITSEPERHLPFVSGYPNGMFHPNQAVSREEIAVMLYRVLTGASEGKDETAAYAPYLDVKAGRWSAAATRFASKSGFLSGYPDGTFQPSKPMIRAEFVSCLARLAEVTGLSTPTAEQPAAAANEPVTGGALVSDSGISTRAALEAALIFTDVKPGAWYAKSVLQAHRLGLVSGYPDGTFRPNEPITRAEASAALNRLLERDAASCPSVDAGSPYGDVSEKHWAYEEIIEASTDHQHMLIKVEEIKPEETKSEQRKPGETETETDDRESGQDGTGGAEK